MDNKNLKYAAIGVGALAVVGGIYYMFFSSSEETKEEVAQSDEMTYDKLKEQMIAEISTKKGVTKMDGGKLSEEFLLNVFYILTKYTALAKTTEDSDSFNKRIEALKNDNHAEYEKLRKEHDLEENTRMQELQSKVFTEFDTTEQEYMVSFQSNARSPPFLLKMQQLQNQVVEEVQKRNPEEGLPEGLTKEKSMEIRDFARSKTQSMVQDLQRKHPNQAEFNERFMFEVSKLDDIIFLTYGFKNTDVLKAFQKYNLIPNQGQQMGL